MIPKTIHYCWFGKSPKSKLILKCINSWKKYEPSYEIVEWNEENIDLESVPLYVKQAYDKKMWAFVSDYVRFYVLYHFGGIYFDTDVELIKPIDDLVANGQFMACERSAIIDTDGNDVQYITVATGLGIALEPYSEICSKLLELYKIQRFVLDNGKQSSFTVVDYVTELLKEYGLKNTNEIQSVAGITIYPKEYFCPKSWEDGRYKKTKNTHAIHHYAASWWSEEKVRHQKLSIRKQRRYRVKECLIHIPNRVLLKILGEEKYSKVKQKLNRGE